MIKLTHLNKGGFFGSSLNKQDELLLAKEIENFCRSKDITAEVKVE